MIRPSRSSCPQGAVWSDGSAYTSKDVVDTFTIQRLQASPFGSLLTM